MEAQRNRALALLSEATSSATAVAIEEQCYNAHRESYSKAVRKVIAKIKRDDGHVLPTVQAFVDSALAPSASVLGRREAREIRVVKATDDGGAPSTLEPPLPEDADKLAIFCPNVLTEAKCRELIERTENHGYTLAMMSVAGGGQVHRPDIRDNERVILWDKDLADELWQSIKPHVPAHVDGKAAVGLSEKLRFYKYSCGQSFAKHVDDATVLDGQQSRYTVIIYLDDRFEGGHTRLCVFDDRFVDRSIDVQPATGAAFIFDHRILHAGMPVTSGVKHALRTDVLYTVRQDT